MILEAGIVFLIGLAGGCLPLVFRWSERPLHASLALSTGIFLGAVFFHLLPAISVGEIGHVDVDLHDHGAHPVLAAELGPAPPATGHEDEAPAGHAAHGDVTAWLFVLLGVLGVYLIESLFLRSGDHDDLHRHRGVSFAALLGLSVHALTAGLAYPAVAGGAAGATVPLFLAIVSHKGLESFSLTTVFALAEFRRPAILAMVVGFSLVTPLGMLMGDALADRLTQDGATILSALAAGTFLFVCLGELLPEVFHHREDILVKIVLLVVGIGAMLALHGAGA